MRLLFLLLSLFTFSAWSKGQFQPFLKDIRYEGSNYGRDIYVYLPHGYEVSQQRYPVLYMHDGQNLFDPNRAFLGQTWRALSTLNDLIEKKIIPPIIVVAIDNTPDRKLEYTPNGNGSVYLNFLARQLKPVIDRTFRTKSDPQHTAILGSSLGGLISLQAGLTHSQTFGLIGALSPSIWWNEEAVLRDYENSVTLPLKIYLDSGTVGGEEPQNVLTLKNILLARDFQSEENLSVIIQQGADHSERAWASRFPWALKFLFANLP